MAIDHIQEMLDAYPAKIDALNNSIEQLTILYDSYVEDQTALNAVMAQVVTEHSDALTEYCTDNGYDLLYKSGDYGVDNLDEWSAGTGDYVATITANNTFTVPGDATAYFTVGLECVIDDNGTTKLVTVQGSVFGVLTTVTIDEVTLSGGGGGNVGEVLDDGDITSEATLLSYQEDMDFVVDYLECTLGDKLYCIDDLVTSYGDSLTLLQDEIDKYSEALSVLERFS
jgi:hypothetical protein